MSSLSATPNDINAHLNLHLNLQLYFPLPFGSEPKKPSINEPISWCDKLDPKGIYDQLAYFDCTILRSVFSDSRDMLREVNDLLENHIKEVHAQGWDINEWRTRNLLMEVTRTASEFRAKAFRWALANVGGQSTNCKTRIALVNFVMTASEFGNQLQTRSDALFKQLAGCGKTRPEGDPCAPTPLTRAAEAHP